MTRELQIRSRLEFSDTESWRAYVNSEVPPHERAFVIALGLTTLYLRFYEVRNQSVPSAFAREFDRLQVLEEPTRTEALSVLNVRIFADMTRQMMGAVPADRPPIESETPRKTIEQLIARLEKENPAFALWCSYKRSQIAAPDMPEWQKYVEALLSSDESDVREFILLMGQLGELLDQFRQQNRAIDVLTRTRICAIQRERAGAERTLATRVLVHELVGALPACTSA